jgi:hypothetical protein
MYHPRAQASACPGMMMQQYNYRVSIAERRETHRAYEAYSPQK